MAVQLMPVSASAVSRILAGEGLKRANKKGWSTGFTVEGAGVMVTVHYQSTDPAVVKREQEGIVSAINTRPGYRAEIGVPEYLQSIGQVEPMVIITRPVTVVDVVELPAQTQKAAISEVYRALNDKGFLLNLSADRTTIRVAWSIFFSGRIRHTEVTFNEEEQGFQTPATMETFRTLDSLLAHIEEFLVEPGER
jgi:hypothetical protein